MTSNSSIFLLLGNFLVIKFLKPFILKIDFASSFEENKFLKQVVIIFVSSQILLTPRNPKYYA
ncbi:hypothetical protein BpHYR1_017922 [Brachionus plicatilis]|uniref:Uncharacterized protein n=1 Tax=Brachionus plicatilis TaxID=10195 RepID=A0A3M7SWZ2_BRAPC|nr:hypothetical protein BpHYR1_017922 [Brachionus plicatilis]